MIVRQIRQHIWVVKLEISARMQNTLDGQVITIKRFMSMQFKIHVVNTNIIYGPFTLINIKLSSVKSKKVSCIGLTFGSISQVQVTLQNNHEV